MSRFDSVDTNLGSKKYWDHCQELHHKRLEAIKTSKPRIDNKSEIHSFDYQKNREVHWKLSKQGIFYTVWKENIMHDNKRMLSRIFRITTPTPNRDFTRSKTKSLARERQDQEKRRIEQENDKMYKRLVSIPTSSYLDHDKLRTEFEKSKKMRDLRARPRYTALSAHRQPNLSNSRLTQTPLPDLKSQHKQQTSPTSLNISVLDSQSTPSEASKMPRSGSVPVITVYKTSRSKLPQPSDSSNLYLTDSRIS